MDFEALGKLVRAIVTNELESGTHATLTTLAQDMAIQAQDVGTKRERAETAAKSIPDDQIPRIAEYLLSYVPLRPADRNALQDAQWANAGYPEIPRRTRREIAQAMESQDLYLDAARFDAVLSELWVLSNDPFNAVAAFFGEPDRSLRAEIARHVHRNPGDWTVVHLFDKLEAFDASDRRFALFLECLSSSDVRPDEEDQRRFVALVNGPLKQIGLELRETGSQGGYPAFEVVALGSSSRGRTKNLIFASQEKPDLRFRDAIDNDIELVSKADRVLVYDRPIGRDGLPWIDLQNWWAERTSIEDAGEAKVTLYRRLRESLPPNSPPQVALFKGYYSLLRGAPPTMPALLPEVWLHWDPVTVRRRGRDALLNSRMDFLVLLPGNIRVVIEVDGKQHYSDSSGRPDAQRYASMMAADRTLRFSGYDVYRFGAAELLGDSAQIAIRDFFLQLFRRHGVAALNRQA